jgi:hypothetical protein
MCRLFVWADPASTHLDPLINSQRPQVGHIIDVLEDGQSGGTAVEGPKATGQFNVVEIPGVLAAKYLYLCRGDPNIGPDVQRSTYLRYRINVLDLAALKQVAPPDSNKIIAPPSEKAVLDLVTVAQPVPVSGIIGDNPLVIG